MKKRLYYFTAILLSAAALSLSSCLKDNRGADFSNVGTLVELPLAAYYGTGNLTPAAIPILTTPQTVPVVVNVASPKPLGSALTVTLALDQAALTAYNNAVVTKWLADSTAAANAGNAIPGGPFTAVLPPSNSYSIPSFKVTIPANQREANLNIQVISADLDPSTIYVLPISIVDASGQKISNYKTILLNVQAKNKYDGIYTITGFVHRDADTHLGGPMISGLTSALATTGANSLAFSQNWADGSETGGVNPITLVVDPNTNAVTITSTVNPTLQNLPGYNSHYDPAKKTFYLGLIWNGADPNHRSAIDTLVYSKTR